MRLSEYLPDFEQYLRYASRLSPITQDHYVSQMKLIAKYLGDCEFEEVTPKSLLDWNISLQKSGVVYNTANVKHAALKCFLTYTRKILRHTSAGPLLDALEILEVPGTRTPKRATYALTEIDRLRLLAHAGLRPLTGARDAAMVQFLWDTGVRRAELAGLMLDNLDLDGETAWVVGKGAKGRSVMFSPETKEQIDIWLQVRSEAWPERRGKDYLFITLSGAPLTPSTVSGILKDITISAGLQGQVWPHLFRHTRLTGLLNQGMSLQNVSRFAGHSDVRTTMRYFHEDMAGMREEYDRAMKREEPE